jgi:putative GTP pyrophosphokinase
MSDLSKSQIDKLGERLKKGEVTEADLRMLDEYRLTFSEAYEFVVTGIRQHLKLEPTGRPAKSTPSIIDKLKRESIRLTQMQDIAGCRLIVDYIPGQNEVVEALNQLFGGLTIVDRRIRPSHGYRAVHAVVNHTGKLVEIQIRTELQHAWAEVCEKLADLFDPGLKYGSGPTDLVEILTRLSVLNARLENLQLNPDTSSLKSNFESVKADIKRALDEVERKLNDIPD